MSMLTSKISQKKTSKHPYLSGNFAPVATTCKQTPCRYWGTIPREFYGGEYVRNGSNPVSKLDSERDHHQFDGDGMLSGVIFKIGVEDPEQIVPHFVSQFVMTDFSISTLANSTLQTPILPSSITFIKPLSSLALITWKTLRAIILAILSYCPGSKQSIKKIIVSNTALLFHNGRALATFEGGPPIRIQLPGLETIGWSDGDYAEGEFIRCAQEPVDGNGPSRFLKAWTTGHPKVDPVTGELIIYRNSFLHPYVQYSVIPAESNENSYWFTNKTPRLINIPVPGVSGAKMMHDFGVSKNYTIILDLPLTLDPLNLVRNKPVVSYDRGKPARFGVFPRRNPTRVRWFETQGCCIFHTANCWDDFDQDRNLTVNLLVCRLTSDSLVYAAGHVVVPPPSQTLDSDEPAQRRQQPGLNPEKTGNDPDISPTAPSPDHPKEEDQCRLYLYQFSLTPPTPAIVAQYALSAIPFEFPTLNPVYQMNNGRYIYGCSTTTSTTFGTSLGGGAKVDAIAKIDVRTLILKGKLDPPTSVTGCVDTRPISEIKNSKDPADPIKLFIMPPGWYAQEARFVAKTRSSLPKEIGSELAEDDGYLVFYAFDETQLDDEGECPENAVSELWIIDAKGMKDVVTRVRLPQRVPYGLHGNWFLEKQIRNQRAFAKMGEVPASDERHGALVAMIRACIIRLLG